MENTDQNLALIQTLLSTADLASELHLLQERSSQVNDAVVESLILLAQHSSEQGELESAIQLADIAINASSILNDSRLLADAQFIKAVILQYGGHLDNAGIYYQRASDLYEKLDAKSSLANCLGNLGLLAHDLGNASQAIEYHCASLAITRQIGNIGAQLADLTNLAAVYYSQGDYIQAKKRYEEVQALAVESIEREAEMDALSGLGLIYRAQGNLEESRDHFECALVIAREIHNQRGEASQLGNLGLVHQDMGDFDRALELQMDTLLTMTSGSTIRGLCAS